MSSREKILSAVKMNQPAPEPLPGVVNAIRFADGFAQFSTVLKNIGGTILEVSGMDEVAAYVKHSFAGEACITTIPGLTGVSMVAEDIDPHSLQHTALAVIQAQFAVAENGAVWVTEQDYLVRALPFICSHLAVIIDKKHIVNNMHEAYDLIRDADYGFGVFIAGPSKTADIEQSLVLGAHGPKTMTVFVISG
ncbi:MAG: LUD domain-containing protein [Ferruginibacter sp.]